MRWVWMVWVASLLFLLKLLVSISLVFPDHIQTGEPWLMSFYYRSQPVLLLTFFSPRVARVELWYPGTFMDTILPRARYTNPFQMSERWSVPTSKFKALYGFKEFCFAGRGNLVSFAFNSIKLIDRFFIMSKVSYFRQFYRPKFTISSGAKFPN